MKSLLAWVLVFSASSVSAGTEGLTDEEMAQFQATAAAYPAFGVADRRGETKWNQLAAQSRELARKANVLYGQALAKFGNADADLAQEAALLDTRVERIHSALVGRDGSESVWAAMRSLKTRVLVAWSFVAPKLGENNVTQIAARAADWTLSMAEWEDVISPLTVEYNAYAQLANVVTRYGIYGGPKTAPYSLTRATDACRELHEIYRIALTWKDAGIQQAGKVKAIAQIAHATAGLPLPEDLK